MPESLLSEPQARTPHHTNRRSFISFSLIATQGLITSVFLEGCRPHSKQQEVGAIQPKTKDELIAILKREFGHNQEFTIKEDGFVPPVATDQSPGEKLEESVPQEQHAQATQQPLQETIPLPRAEEPKPVALGPVVTPEIAQQPQTPPEPIQAGERICDVAERTSTMTLNDVGASALWLWNYRASTDEVNSIGKVDCNDYSNINCETLSRKYDMPMYLISFWPEEASRTGQDSWHMAAACKFRENEYLILDNDERAIFWYGSLQEFADTYGKDGSLKKMNVIPHIGIAKYVRPAHDIVPAKIGLQLSFSCTEERMECMPIANPPEQKVQDPQLNLARRNVFSSLIALLKP